jgi:hypothetical protein
MTRIETILAQLTELQRLQQKLARLKARALKGER